MSEIRELAKKVSDLHTVFGADGAIDIAHNKLAQHILATTRDDDGEMITEDAMESHPDWEYDHEFENWRHETSRGDVVSLTFKDTGYEACINLEPLDMKPETKGQLRKLVEALEGK